MLKFAIFSALNSEPRTSVRSLSFREKVFAALKSTTLLDGPRNTLLGALPNWKLGGCWKAAVLKYRARLQPLARPGSPTRLGRSVPAGKPLVVLAESNTVNTAPDCST